MSGYVDLHCHYLPGIDDGVRTLEEGIQLCQGLASIGYERVVATPHIRTRMFDNNKSALIGHAQAFKEATAEIERMPALGLGAEHYFDDVFWRLFTEGNAVAYPGEHAILVEFPTELLPMRIGDFLFEIQTRGFKPVIAHPERYRPFFKNSDALRPLVQGGALPLLDVMSLVDRYGSHPRQTAERLLEEGLYYAACSDAHRPTDVPVVKEAIERLHDFVGEEQAHQLLGEHPRAILNGEASF